MIKNWFTTNENIDYYNYIFNRVYKLAFVDKIENKIDKIIKNICKTNKIYKDFVNYFLEQWSPFFKNKILVLKNINKKFQMNNCFENFNKRFKIIYNMVDNMDLIIFVEQLIELLQDIKIFYIKEINKIPKKSFKKIYFKLKKYIKIISDEEEDQNILKELELDNINLITKLNIYKNEEKENIYILI